MNWLEWLDWKFYHWRKRRPCRAGQHDPVGPSLTLGGWYVYSCSRGCGWRVRADRLDSASAVGVLVLPDASADNKYSVKLESE